MLPSPDSPARHSPAAERNQGPLLVALRSRLAPQGLALEIASGTGQHAAHFARGLPGWTWQPSDPDPAALGSIAAWCRGLPNVRPPLALDVMADDWHGAPRPVDLVFCANLLHIAPWPACGALMRGAARHLSPAGRLLTYGPYLVDGTPTAPGNLSFDADLRARNPAWGLRRLDDVGREAGGAGLALAETVAMPANNLLLVWQLSRPDG
jgi:SAM-dependent methyltransferase